jgi:uncharacterized protein YqjF (DUF2071 family)
MMKPIFLTANWQRLIMANYTLPPELLQAYTPPGTVLDEYKGQCYVSLVGFMFADTKVLGLSIPFHRNFEEVNLRFYVRYHDPELGEWKRGTVFISEIVPKAAISFVANTLYGEHYSTRRMRHLWEEQPGNRLKVAYEWKHRGQWNKLSVIAQNQPQALQPGSEEEFIAEHYWGYTKRRGGGSSEYQVEHPPWETLPVESYEINCDGHALYGPAFGEVLEQSPSSVFLAVGSAVQVRQGKHLPI